jgi:predicted lipid-binding transport protein (Tim44 family)
MKNLVAAIMVAVVALTAGVSDAQAKRLGGGGTYGRQSQNVSRQAPSPMYQQGAKPAQAAPAPAAAPQAPQAPQPKPASPWKGMLGGALLGLGLGALLSSMGLGGMAGGIASGLGSLLMIGLLVAAGVFIFRMLRRSNGGSLRPAYEGPAQDAMRDTASRLEPVQPVSLQAPAAAAGTGQPWGVPADFDRDGFLRHAKTCFIRLQAAWDKGEVNDLREFTTPEMFGELRMQLHERGSAANHTDVVSINAELLGIETVGEEYLASVRYDGMIREEEHAQPVPFAEVWNFVKPVSGGGWALAGIQQLN